MRCKNCSQILYGEKKFCSNCGQKNIPKITLKYLFEEILENILNLDSKMFSTLKYLLFKPGFLSKEFKEGRRVKYVLPVRFYIITSLLFFLMISMIRLIPNEIEMEEEQVLNAGFVSEDGGSQISKEKYRELVLDDKLDSYLRDSLEVEDGLPHFLTKQMIKAEHGNGAIDKEALNHLPLFLLLFIPLISLVYKMSFIRNKFNYIDHVVFNVHFNSVVLVLLGINELIKLVVGNSYNEDLGIGIASIIAIVYLFIAINKFYERKGWVILYKLFFLLIGYMVLIMVFTILLLLVSFIAN